MRVAALPPRSVLSLNTHKCTHTHTHKHAHTLNFTFSDGDGWGECMSNIDVSSIGIMTCTSDADCDADYFCSVTNECLQSLVSHTSLLLLASLFVSLSHSYSLYLSLNFSNVYTCTLTHTHTYAQKHSHTHAQNGGDNCTLYTDSIYSASYVCEPGKREPCVCVCAYVREFLYASFFVHTLTYNRVCVLACLF